MTASHSYSGLPPRLATGRHCWRRSAAAVVLAGCLGDGDDSVAPAAQLKVLSSTSPDWVSGGDALVKIDGSYGAGSSLVVKVNGVDQSSAFGTIDPKDGRRVGVVSGLAAGRNTLTVDVTASGQTAPYSSSSLVVTNYPRTGPMFSGPQETPFICETQSFTLPDGTQPRRAARRQLLGRDAHQLRLPHHRDHRRAVQAADRARGDAAGGRGADHDERRQDRQLHRAHRDRHRQPRDLPDGRAARPDDGGDADLDRAVGGLERPAGLHLRRRLHRRLVPPGRGDRRRARRQHPAAGLCDGVVVAQRVRQQLPRPHRRRVDDDGQGALRRDLRPAALHHRLGLLGRLLRSSTRSPTTTPGCSTASCRAAASRRSASRRSTRSPTAAARQLLQRTSVPGTGQQSRSRRAVTGVHDLGHDRHRHGLRRRDAHRRRRPSARACCRRRSATTRPPIRPARAATSTTMRSTSTDAIRPPASRGGRSTTSACSTACRRSTPARSASTSSSTSTRPSAATTSTATSWPRAPWPTRWRRAPPTRPAA